MRTSFLSLMIILASTLSIAHARSPQKLICQVAHVYSKDGRAPDWYPGASGELDITYQAGDYFNGEYRYGEKLELLDRGYKYQAQLNQATDDQDPGTFELVLRIYKNGKLQALSNAITSPGRKAWAKLFVYSKTLVNTELVCHVTLP